MNWKDSATTYEEQRSFWNKWNTEANRSTNLAEVSRRQGDIIGQWLGDLKRSNLHIIEVGCGAAWLTPSLTAFGAVTGTDLSDQLLSKAQARHPEIKFVAGDFMALEFRDASFDVAVSLEVLAHVANQQAFIDKIARLLKPGGYLMMATQNKPVLKNHNRIPSPSPGQLRKWTDAKELNDLLHSRFDVLKLFSVTPVASRGWLRYGASRKVNTIAGPWLQNLLERKGYGWTLMTLARKRVED